MHPAAAGSKQRPSVASTTAPKAVQKTPETVRNLLPQQELRKATFSNIDNSHVSQAPAQCQRPGFDLQFVRSDAEALAVLDVINQQHPQTDVVLITSPDGLYQDNLTRRLTITASGNNQFSQGRLFDDGLPITLALDIRHMTANEIAVFNDLLDPDAPCLYNRWTDSKTLLGSAVTLVVLVSPQQLLETGAGSENNPGADFWRRVQRPDGCWQDQRLVKDKTPGSRVEPLPPAVDSFQPATVDDPAPVILNLHMDTDWRRLLYGGPGVDNSGRIGHIPGALEQLQPGQRVVLKGADWSNLELQQHIRQLQSRGRYQCNGKTRLLPAGITFYQATVNNEELGDLCRETVALVAKPSEASIIINRYNLAQWLSTIKINDDGSAAVNHSLQDQLNAEATVAVTSPLSASQWFALLGRLQCFYRQSGSRPRLFFAHDSDQPPQLTSIINSQSRTFEEPGQLPQEREQEQGLYHSSRVRARSYRDAEQAIAWLNSETALQQHPPLVIRITSSTRPGQLFNNISVKSENTPRFELRETQLQKALKQGREVIILGLETNPALQQILEPLCTRSASLLIHGSLQSYPDARICLLWPVTGRPASLLWKNAILKAQPLLTIDLWQCAAQRRNIALEQLPKADLLRLYRAFKTVPKHQATSFNALPPITVALLENLIISARLAQSAEGCSKLENRHWRKAINSVLSHCTRANPAVRDFMKAVCERLLPDEDHGEWVDPERLSETLRALPVVNPNTVEQHFWSLARAFGPAVIKQLGRSFCEPLYVPYSPEHKYSPEQIIHALIVAHAPESLKEDLKTSLQPCPELICQLQSLPQHSTRCRKQLEDALASGWSVNRDNFPQGIDLTTLANNIYAVSQACSHADDASNTAEGKQIIRARLEQALHWRGEGEAPVKRLVDNLYHGHIHQADREQRRLAQLQARLQASPVIFIEGETATGKSHSAAQVARMSGPAFITALGPDTDDQDLVQCWQWQPKGEHDRSMVRQPKILLQWAEARTRPGQQYVTLVLDEANLAGKGTLNGLLGLWQSPPCVYIDGQPTAVTRQHRVILTGNPSSYAGRHTDPALLAWVQRVYYPPLDNEFLQTHIAEPTLLTPLQGLLNDESAATLTTRAAATVMALWPHYARLLPDYHFTPRDLTDICAWIGWYLQQAKALRCNTVTGQQLNALIWQAFQDTFAAGIADSEQGAAQALEYWFDSHYPRDATLLALVQNNTLEPALWDFVADTALWQPEFNSSPAAVTELVQALQKDVMRCQQAFRNGMRHPGRQATLIEGPTGRGKDITLKSVLHSCHVQARNHNQPMPEIKLLNACDCGWDTIRETIQEARQHGGIVVISELNLIDSAHLEGELNAILAGDAHYGFHLFATTNPISYAGRKPLSSALKGRFRYLPVRAYNRAELCRIAARVLPHTASGEACAKHLVELHCRLQQVLLQKGHQLQPVSGDLQQLAMALRNKNDLTPDTISQLFNRHYQLYLLAAKQSAQSLTSLEPDHTHTACDRTLCQWLHQTITWLKQPWQVRRGVNNGISPQALTITIAEQLDDLSAGDELIRQLAQYHWTLAGMPLTLPENTSALTQSLFTGLQRYWLTQTYANIEPNPDIIFPFSQEQIATQAMASNWRYHFEAWRLMADKDLSLDSSLQHCWQQLKQITILPEQKQLGVPHVAQQTAELVSPAAPTQFRMPQPDQPSLQPSEPAPCATAQPWTFSRPAPHRIPAPSLQTHLQPHTTTVTETATTSGWWRSGPPKKQRQPATTGKSARKSPHPKLQHADAIAEIETDTRKPSRIPSRHVTRIFQTTSINPYCYRLQVRQLQAVSAGKLLLVTPEPGRSGLESISPGILPASGCLPLTEKEHYGRITITWADKWHYLPGLSSQDTITSIRTRPEKRVKLVRDSYSGLLMIHCADTSPGEVIRVDYILSMMDSCGITPSAANQTEQGHCSSVVIKNVCDQLFSPASLQKLPTPQAEQLSLILHADDDERRIAYICDYCDCFEENHRPGREPLLPFLLRERQGACLHRSVAFVALCQYFNIPARVVSNDLHAFPEYSLTGGSTWNTYDLGGSATRVKITNPDFLSLSRSSNWVHDSQQIMPFLKSLHPEQHRILATITGASQDAVSQAIAAGLSLPAQTSQMTLLDVVTRLWQQKDITAFSLGCEFINNSPAEHYSDSFVLVCFTHNNRTFARMAIGITPLLKQNQTASTVVQGLKQMYERWVVPNKCEQRWNIFAVHIALKIWDITDEEDEDEPNTAPLPGAILFFQAALEQGWLTLREATEQGLELHNLLTRLATIESLKTLAMRALADWYSNLPGVPQNLSEIVNAWNARDPVWQIPPSYRGYSPSLESAIKNSSPGRIWTSTPEGPPDIERLLMQQPAFEVFATRESSRERPVVLLYDPWSDRNRNSLLRKAEACCEQYGLNHPEDKKLLDKQKMMQHLREQYRQETESMRLHLSHRAASEITAQHESQISASNCALTPQERLRLLSMKNKFTTMLEQSMSHYLYTTINRETRQLFFCQLDAEHHGKPNAVHHQYGYYQPQSPYALDKLFQRIKNQTPPGWVVNRPLLHKALGMPDALILDENDMKTIALEFLDSVDTDAFAAELGD